MADKTATFGIRVDAQTNAAKAASSVDGLRTAIEKSQDKVKSYGSALRQLRGSSDEVKAAKDRLKGAIAAERDAISRNALALGKLGTTYDDAAKKSKTFSEALGVAGTIAKASATAVLAAATAVAGLAVAFGKYAIESANALRTQGLWREAATGSAENARAFGHQIDALAAKVPLARDELQELSLSLSRSLVGARISGQGIVDTFNAVAQTTAAMGQQAGSTIEGIITRGKRAGMLGLNPQELLGTGLNFQDVAKKLSSQLKIGLGAAQNMLALGRVRLDDGAKAIRAAVEERFGSINARRLLDLGVQFDKFKETLQGLTSDIDLEPLLNGVKHFFDLFSQTTVTGQAVKQLVTLVGNGLVGALTKGGTTAESIFHELVIGAQRAVIWFLETKKSVTDLWASSDELRAGVEALKVGLLGIAAVVGVTIAALTALTLAAVGLFGAIITGAEAFGEDLYNAFAKVSDWAAGAYDAAKNFAAGFVNGIRDGIADVVSAVRDMGSAAWKTITSTLKIQSPSRLTFSAGENVAEGMALGIEARSGRVADAAGDMAEGAGQGAKSIGRPAPTTGTATSGGASAAALAGATVTVEAVFPNAKNGPEVAAALSSRSFVADLVQAIDQIARSAAVPTQKPLGGLT